MISNLTHPNYYSVPEKNVHITFSGDLSSYQHLMATVDIGN